MSDELMNKEVEIPRIASGELAPEWRIVALKDDMSHWNSAAEGYHRAMQAAGWQIYTVYIYNARSVTYCCEITPSYELEFFDFVTERTFNPGVPDCSEEDLEFLHDWLEESKVGQPDSVYVHCSGLDATFGGDRHKLIKDEALDPDSPEETLKDLRDWVWEKERGNPTFC